MWQLVNEGEYEEAVKLIRKDNPFPSACAYVCEHPCEAHCRRAMVDDAINICGLKRFAVDHAKAEPAKILYEKTGKNRRHYRRWPRRTDGGVLSGTDGASGNCI